MNDCLTAEKVRNLDFLASWCTAMVHHNLSKWRLGYLIDTLIKYRYHYLWKIKMVFSSGIPWSSRPLLVADEVRDWNPFWPFAETVLTSEAWTMPGVCRFWRILCSIICLCNRYGAVLNTTETHEVRYCHQKQCHFTFLKQCSCLKNNIVLVVQVFAGEGLLKSCLEW